LPQKQILALAKSQLFLSTHLAEEKEKTQELQISIPIGGD
jgi:hypothetical protein